MSSSCPRSAPAVFPIITAASDGDVDQITMLLKDGADPVVANEKGK